VLCKVEVLATCYDERMGRYKQYSKEDQKLLATWAIACAERVLPLFEAISPADDRPRTALAAGREWVRTGIFHMATIRAASLGAHAAAKQVEEHDAACFAAHAAGQAVGTAHVAQHAYGGSFYALKAIAAASPQNAKEKVAQELRWQEQALPEHLRRTIMSRILVDDTTSKLRISIDKGEGF
jgi:immunity protein 5 of polymorphic toxin system